MWSVYLLMSEILDWTIIIWITTGKQLVRHVFYIEKFTASFTTMKHGAREFLIFSISHFPAHLTVFDSLQRSTRQTSYANSACKTAGVFCEVCTRDIRLWNVSDLEFDISQSLKVKCDSTIVLPIYGFLLMFITNIGPN